MEKTRAFKIPKSTVKRAFELVKANKGSHGVDKESLVQFEANLKGNLYKLWNRMSSGCYFPSAVREVRIPKKSGGERILGVPTVMDRVAQMVVKLSFEPNVESILLPDCYGYRPNKSALDAVEVTRSRCWQWSWVLEFDIVGLFDHLPHDLLMKAVRAHTKERWVILYIERWLKAPLEHPDGTQSERTAGTPQGGVISPVLANLFLHYAFDLWMHRRYPNLSWCRYSDDGLVHCRTEPEALALKEALEQRFLSCGLRLHPEKTRVVYCRRGHGGRRYPTESFEFLGYCFRRRARRDSRRGTCATSFTPAVSKAAQKAMRAMIRRSDLRNRTDWDLVDISKRFNPVLRGWLNYYGHYRRTEMNSVLRHFNQTLVCWAARKFKRFHDGKRGAARFIQEVARRQPRLFVHWQEGKTFV